MYHSDKKLKRQFKYFKNKFLFTREGNVFTWDGEKWKEKSQYDCNGYKCVSINGQNYYVHRLMAEFFLADYCPKLEINHKDENKANNHIDNLEVCDHEYNLTYGTRLKRMSKTKEKEIVQLTLDGKFVRRWKSTDAVFEELGFHNANISMCLNGKLQQAYGFKWVFAKEYNRVCKAAEKGLKSGENCKYRNIERETEILSECCFVWQHRSTELSWSDISYVSEFLKGYKNRNILVNVCRLPFRLMFDYMDEMERKCAEETKSCRLTRANDKAIYNRFRDGLKRFSEVRETSKKCKAKRVVQLTLDGSVVKEYPSLHEVERETGWLFTSISACCNGATKTSHGFVWKYIE